MEQLAGDAAESVIQVIVDDPGPIGGVAAELAVPNGADNVDPDIGPVLGYGGTYMGKAASHTVTPRLLGRSTVDRGGAAVSGPLSYGYLGQARYLDGDV